MKILMLYPWSPYPPVSGATKRMFHVLEQIAPKHEVTILAFGSPTEEKNFQEHFAHKCKQIVFVDDRISSLRQKAVHFKFVFTHQSGFTRLYQKSYEAALNRLIRENDFDIIYANTILLGYYTFPDNIPLVGDTQNVEYDNIYRTFKETKSLVRKLYSYQQYLSGKRDEIRNGNKFDVILATCARDRDILKEDIPDKTFALVPNGVDLDFFIPLSVEPEPDSIVFTGLMNYYPNDHGITFFLDKVFPLIQRQAPDTKIYVVGSNPSKKLLERKSDKIIVTGYVDDVRPYIDRAQVCVVPILIGGGTRLKALEAMAMKKPIVTTSVGCEGIDLTHGKSALFADEPEHFAAEVIRLFNDPLLRKQLAENGYEIARTQYDWKSIGNTLNDVFLSLEPTTTPASYA